MRKFYRVIISICFGFVLSTLFPAHLVASEKGADLSLGERIYKEHCKVCHGEEGNGKTFVANVLKPTPKNFTNPMVINSLTRETMIHSILYGRPGTGMMPWEKRLTQKEIEAVVDYILKTFMKLVTTQ